MPWRLVITVAVLLIVPAMTWAEVAVIGHPSVPVEALSSAELLDFYTGDVKRWHTGDVVVVFDLQVKGNVKDAFYGFIGKTTARMKSIWMKNMLSGEGRPPEALGSQADMLARVAATPGAIGYVDRQRVKGNVVILTIIEDEK